MSISKKTLEAAHIALLDNGQIALCDETRAGNLRIHRVLSREEVLNSALMLYLQFQKDHPDSQVLQVPFGNKILAMTLLDSPSTPPVMEE